MQQLNLRFLMKNENKEKSVTWHLKDVDAHLSTEDLKRAVKTLANCRWLTDAKGAVLWPLVNQVEAIYETTQFSDKVVVDI